MSIQGSWLGRQWRKLTGTYGLCESVSAIQNHVLALTEVVQVIVAEMSGTWLPDKRERIQKNIANFTLVSSQLSKLRPMGNPFTAGELDRLRYYTDKAQKGQTFEAEEARDFKQLSQRASGEYPNQDWVAELLKVALFIFAIYALSKALEKKD